MIGLCVLAAILVGCGGAGPDADEGKSHDEIKKQAASMDAEELQKVIDAYTKALADAADEQRGALESKLNIYQNALKDKAKDVLKKMPGGG